MAVTSAHAYQITGFHADIHPAFRQRLLAMGLVPGAIFRIIRTAPLGDPIEIETRRSHLALRRKDLQLLLFQECATPASVQDAVSTSSQPSPNNNQLT